MMESAEQAGRKDEAGAGYCDPPEENRDGTVCRGKDMNGCPEDHDHACHEQAEIPRQKQISPVNGMKLMI
jgi:hypothetical protein